VSYIEFVIVFSDDGNSSSEGSDTDEEMAESELAGISY